MVKYSHYFEYKVVETYDCDYIDEYLDTPNAWVRIVETKALGNNKEHVVYAVHVESPEDELIFRLKYG